MKPNISTRHDINNNACRTAMKIIQRATGKPLSYYASKSRKTELVAYRALFVYLAVELGASYVAAGQALSRSHATAIHAYNCYNRYATTWEPLRLLREKLIRYTTL